MTRIQKLILGLSFFLELASWASKVKNADIIVPQNPQVPKIETKKTDVSLIDLQSLQRLLGLERNIQSLGFQEKAFNTCKVGFGFDAKNSCQQKYLVVIHFKIACRASEGTVSTILTEDDLAVVANQKLQWFLKNASGQVETESNGLAEIRMLSDISQKSERLRLSNSNDFVLMRAGEIRSLIVPINWCN